MISSFSCGHIQTNQSQLDQSEAPPSWQEANKYSHTLLQSPANRPPPSHVRTSSAPQSLLKHRLGIRGDEKSRSVDSTGSSADINSHLSTSGTGRTASQQQQQQQQGRPPLRSSGTESASSEASVFVVNSVLHSAGVPLFGVCARVRACVCVCLCLRSAPVCATSPSRPVFFFYKSMYRVPATETFHVDETKR